MHSIDKENALKRISGLLHEFKNLVIINKAVKVKQMDTFIGDYQNHLKTLPSTARFNLLDITGVGNDEVKHSSILAWLLSPNAQHACGTSFLRLFLKAAHIDIPKEHLNGCYVRTEFSGNESIIDILIYKLGKFLVYVENKTISGEGENQIDREYRDMHRAAESLRVPEKMRFSVFLTPRGHSPESGDPTKWITVSYIDLAREFLTERPNIHNQKVAFLVEDLIDQYKRFEFI